MKYKLKTSVLLLLAGLTIAFSSCSTINNLADYDLTGTPIALDLMAPSRPEVDISSSYYDTDDSVLGAAIQIGANLIKADQEKRTQQKLESALKGMYLPEMVGELVLARTVQTLDAVRVDKVKESDVVLEVDIDHYGIESYSSGAHIEMVIDMEVRLYHKMNREIIWQRHVNTSKDVTPGFFGLDAVVGDVMTIAVLDKLEEAELAEGFERLMYESMDETLELLQKDIREARRRD